MSFGQFDQKGGKGPMSDINVTPLVDVMLVLVVILIITAPLMASSLKLDLPQSAAATASDTPKFLSVSVKPDGQLFLADKPIADDALRAAFAEAHRKEARTEVQIRADQRAAYGAVAKVLGMAQEAGLSRIGFIAERAKK
jgi:biopolymer transport protein TolR